MNTLISGTVPIRQHKTTAVKVKARNRDINVTVTPVILR
jgi:hypothetical protein